MCAEKRRPGRPAIYDSVASKKKAERSRLKAAGFKNVHIIIPEEYKTLFDGFCAKNKMSQKEAFCYMLDLYYDFSEL